MVLLDLADVASVSLAPPHLVRALLVEAVSAGQLKGFVHVDDFGADLAFFLDGSNGFPWAVAADQHLFVLGEDGAFRELAFLWTGSSKVCRVVVVFFFRVDTQSLCLLELAALVQMVALIGVIIKIRDPSVFILFLHPIVLVGVSLDSHCLVEFYHLWTF